MRIDYEKEKVSEEDARVIAQAIHGYAATVTGYDPKDISVFASANQITVNAAPIEVYIYATFPTVSEEDMEAMLKRLAEMVRTFKQEQNITTPFNLSVVKMNWRFELEV